MPLARTRPIAGLAVIGAAALIAGCGGGDSDAPSAEEFRQQADAICADANARLGALEEPASAAEILPYLQAGLPIQEDEIARIRELEAPEDLQPTLDGAADLLQQRQEAIQAAADRIAGGEDPAAVIDEVDPEIQRLRDEARAAARELGLTVCGTDPDDAAQAGTTGTAASAPDAPVTSPGGAGQASAYVDDVQAAAAALRGFGTTLQGTSSLEGLRERLPQAQAQLDEFDAAIAELDGYTLDDQTLEAQRQRLAEAGPEVSDVLRRFVAAASSGDSEALASLVPEVQQAITEFGQAATP
jgi:hypothetical protein